jgi:hypothetical protein
MLPPSSHTCDPHVTESPGHPRQRRRGASTIVPDIQPHLAGPGLEALTDAPWRTTNRVPACAYVTRHAYPDLYKAMQALLRAYGIERPRQGWTYRCVRVGAYTYWVIPPLLPRERCPEAGQDTGTAQAR